MINKKNEYCKYKTISKIYICIIQVMEALMKDKEEMEKMFTIHQQDVDKLKEKEVLSKFLSSLSWLWCEREISAEWPPLFPY